MQDNGKLVTGPFDRVSPEVAEKVETTRHTDALALLTAVGYQIC
jgi:hypothetical protein